MSLTLPQLAAHAARVLQQNPRQRVLAYAWPHPWSGGDAIEVDGRALPLRYCESSLAVREALSQRGDSPMVLLVNAIENRLGQDVLARLVKHSLLHVDRWQLVQESYGVRHVDPRLFALHWMPPMLLDAMAIRQPFTSPVLSYAEAMATCLSFAFCLPIDQPRLEDLAIACESNTSRWLAIPEEQRAHFRQHLVTQFGALAGVFVSAMEHGTGHAIVATGLACEVLYSEHAASVQELRDARIRLESRLGGYRLEAVEGRHWARLAIDLSATRDAGMRQNDERLATDLLNAVGARSFLALSSVLPAGLDARLSELGTAVEQFLRLPEMLAEVEAAVARVSTSHTHAPDHPGPEMARMVARLCRSLVAPGTSEPVADPVGRYVAHGSWQDWARRALRGARPESFARSVTRLLDRVAEVRRVDDQAFATSLVAAMGLGESLPGSIPIEMALDEVIVPLARHNPVLMIVLDGMSVDVANAIGESLSQRGWVAWEQGTRPGTLLATVPSVTECSRCSLLAGRLMRGVARQEAQAFAMHEGLRRTSRSDAPPVLFHKAAIEQGQQLSGEVAAAIADTRQHVVAVVINAIDDALAKSEQVRIDWDIEAIPLLAQILEHARRTGRAVVLTSDHGHVLDRASRLLPGGTGERYRLPPPPPEEGELLASGLRVRTLTGDDIVVPWREDIRYSPKKNGYHGGISRQEMVVPLSIWTTGSQPLPESDFQLARGNRPDWWDDAGGGHSVAAAPASATRTTGRRPRPSVPARDDLFSTSQQSDLADRLNRSPSLEYQRERIGRLALEPARLATLVRRLEQGGGRASMDQLAKAIDLPPVRMRGVVSVLERTLNLDGFPVITLEQGTGTVLLDLTLLRTQFQL